MSWDNYARQLGEGSVVKFRPKGNSMTPKINSGAEVVVSPIGVGDELKAGDVVFCRVKGNFYVHLVKSVKDGKYLISNNKGKENGWIGKTQIFGKVIRIQ